VDDGRLLSTRRYADSMVSVALAVDGEYAVSGGYDKLVRLWHMPTRTQVGCFEGHTSGVQSVAYSRDGRYAASGGHDNTVRLWPLPPMTKRTPAAMP
jgi:WD40 repeat protein